MRNRLFVFLTLMMLFAIVLPAAAQTGTATPGASATAQSTAQPNNQSNGQGNNQQGQNQQNQSQSSTNAGQISRIRIAYLVPDGPVLVPFVNGQASNIQLLQAPALTGWIEFPGSVTLSLVPQGNAQGNAGGIGPISLNGQNSRWTTIAVVGSYQAGTMRAFAFNESYTQVAGNCARVTVFNAVESNLGSTLLLNNQSVFNSALNFPGNQQGRGTAAGTSSGQNNQKGTAGQSGTGGQGSAAGQNGQNNNGVFNNSGCNNQTASTGATSGQVQNTAGGTDSQTGNGIGTFGCAALLTTGLRGTGTNSQQGSGSGANGSTSANNQQGSTSGQGSTNGSNGTNNQGNTVGNNSGALGGTAFSFGQTSGNCGYTFDVPAGTYNLQFAPGGANGNGGAGVTSQFNAGSYYFVAEIGTATNPQVFVASVAGSQLTPLIAGSQNGAQNGQSNGQNNQNGSGSGNGTGNGSGNGNGSGSGNG